MAEQHKLWVVESNGTPRSGKGTITNGLTEAFVGTAQDETGADYRTVTYGLLLDGNLKEEMDEQAVARALAHLSESEIASYAARRYEIIAEAGEDALYTPEVSSLVGLVSPLDLVRKAVKQGFTRRLMQHADDPDVQLLFVDGRNLTPVIQKISGVEILLRQFVDCQPLVAAQREARRYKKDLNDPANDEWFRITLANIRNRQISDEQREIDPVKPDSDAIDYWFNTSILDETTKKFAITRGITFAHAATILTERATEFRRDGRYGAGAKALAQKRQIYFDTSEVPKSSMLEFARRLVSEALDQQANLYVPLNDRLLTA